MTEWAKCGVVFTMNSAVYTPTQDSDGKWSIEWPIIDDSNIKPDVIVE